MLPRLPSATLDPEPSDPEPSDPELLARARAGDPDAFGVLHVRHAAAARRLAGRLSRNGHDADDLVAEAFARVLAAVQQGRGPTVAFGPYLCSTVRRLAYDRSSREQRERVQDPEIEHAPPERVDPVVASFERSAAAAAFATLPERWQAVLWHLEVEGAKPREVAPLVGLTPNAVSALAVRAREGLRQAYLVQHAVAAPADQPACRSTRQRLGGYLRGGLGPTVQRRVSDHLEQCGPCQDALLELLDEDAVLRAIAVLAVTGPVGLDLVRLSVTSATGSSRGPRGRRGRRPRARSVGLGVGAAAVCVVGIALVGAGLRRPAPSLGVPTAAAHTSVAGTAAGTSHPTDDQRGPDPAGRPLPANPRDPAGEPGRAPTPPRPTFTGEGPVAGPAVPTPSPSPSPASPLSPIARRAPAAAGHPVATFSTPVGEPAPDGAAGSPASGAQPPPDRPATGEGTDPGQGHPHGGGCAHDSCTCPLDGPAPGPAPWCRDASDG